MMVAKYEGAQIGTPETHLLKPSKGQWQGRGETVAVVNKQLQKNWISTR